MVAGLWTRGTGKVVTPAASSLFFLPQKPYMPLGSLRSQLLFPSGCSLPLCVSDLVSGLRAHARWRRTCSWHYSLDIAAAVAC